MLILKLQVPNSELGPNQVKLEPKFILIWCDIMIYLLDHYVSQ